MSTANVIFRATLEEAFAEAGMAFPDRPLERGKLVRFSTSDKPRDTAGWCKLFDDGRGAAFGCNRQGTTFVWQQRDVNAPPPSKEERQAARAKFAQDKEQARRKTVAQQLQAATVAARIVEQAGALDAAHPYVVRKGITPYAARQDYEGAIVVPVHGADGAVQSVQFIRADGSKRFLSQARMKGGRLYLGQPMNGTPLLLAEGWATACSLHAATGAIVVVGFSGNNLACVAADLRRQFPDSPLRIAADLDSHGKGLQYARAAANVGAPASVLLPAFADGRGDGDFNDLHQVDGIDAVRRQLAEASVPACCVVMPFEVSPLPTSDARDGTGDSRPLTEYGNAQRLFDAYGERLRYVYDAQSWIVWQDGAWQWDAGSGIRSLAAHLPAGIYAEGARHLCDGEHFAKWARKSQELRVVNAAVAMLSDFAAVRLPLACVDADHLVVGYDQARQVIDLRSGATRAATPGDYVTKSLGIDNVGSVDKAVRWSQFLDQVFEGNVELIKWLQRFCGYLLTGSTQEQVFLFCYGHGANGKSVFIEVLKHVMGDYARAIASETLADSKRQAGGATPDLAALIGARLVLCSETEDNTALAESLVKSLVSGDTMAVRALYSAPVQFTPNFKLVMAGNHKPIVRGNDNGIWRRIRLVPFNRTFTPEERDPHLLATLKAESSHILAWMVVGTIEWQRQGLGPTPNAIAAATEEYREDQDITGRWLEECTLRDLHAEETVGDLYASYSQWCLDNGLRPASTVVLGRRLSERGYFARKSGGKRLWRGLRLKGVSHLSSAAYLLATEGD